jgi:hypothetical protein
MTDKELLELAAKAAGITMAPHAFMHKYGCAMLCEDGTYFNPLTDDGDALRLAVKLRIEICYPYMLPQGIDAVRASTDTYESIGEDPYAATRLAIVRAAAEIGKQKE